MKRRWALYGAVLAALLYPGAGWAEEQAAGQPKDGYAGTEACMDCHEEEYGSYLKSSHSLVSDPRTPASKHGCETCHGPGREHVDQDGGKGVGKVIGLGADSTASAEEKAAACLQCHSTTRAVALWPGSAHQSRNVACSDCHSGHSGGAKNLAAATESQVCDRCHSEVTSQLLKPSHHPIREGKIGCSDCHNPHGSVTDSLIGANSVNDKCYQCHTEKRGPFLWQHAPVSENCATCHTPHGSSHDKLLVAKRPFLCQSCHSNSRHPGTLYAVNPAVAGQPVYVALNNRVYYRSCSNCHYQVHGSNHPSGKSLGR